MGLKMHDSYIHYMLENSSPPDTEPIDDITLSEASCAKVFAAYFPGNFKYKGKKTWEYFDPDKNKWQIDKHKTHLKRCIRTQFASLIMIRAKLWQEYLQKMDHNIHDINFRVTRMMDIARKLQNDEYLNSLIREIAEWYNTE